MFVEPDLVRLPLEGGEWIEVKRELTAGEHRRMFARQIKGYDPATGKAMYDPEQVGFARVAAYLVGWSFTRGGKAVPVSEAAIDALDQATYVAIVNAIAAHETAEETAREEKKRTTPGGSRSDPISISAA
jgi:hypothetical protein